jgi:ATP-binding cassette subfamily C protein LapB
MTIVISTHRMSLLAFVDRLLVFDRGRLMADGPRDTVLGMLQGGNKTAGQPPRGAGAEPMSNVVSSVGRSNAAI